MREAWYSILKKNPLRRLSFHVTTQVAMMDGEERTTKYAEGAKREAKRVLKDESYSICGLSRISLIS
jgi:hypothetical protein